MRAYVLYCEGPHGYWGSAVAAQCPDVFRKEVAIDLKALQHSAEAFPHFEPKDVAQVFGMGFSVVVLFFLVGRGVGEVLRLIRKG